MNVMRWVPDCGGKEDFDGEIIRLSSRYWPPRFGTRPSGTATLLLQGEPCRTQEFEADTEAEVKAAVEAWARAEIEALSALLRVRSEVEAIRCLLGTA